MSALLHEVIVYCSRLFDIEDIAFLDRVVQKSESSSVNNCSLSL